MKKIVVVGVGCVSAKYLPGALRAAGYEPVFVADPSRYVGAPRAALESCTCLPADIADSDELMRALSRDPHLLTDAVAISSPFDEVFPVTQRVADKLDLEHPAPVLAELSDKVTVAALVPEYSPWTVFIDPRAVPDQLLADQPYPLLLKPALATGALGVCRFDPARSSPVELIRDSGITAPLDQPWLAQQVIEGELVSLEGYIHDGALTIVGFSRRTRIGATEVSNLFPANGSLPAAVRERCTAAVSTLADRSGFRYGYVHSEFLATVDSAYLIDANMGRIGGAGIVEQIALAHRIDPADVVRHALLLPIDRDTSTPSYVPWDQARSTTSYWYGMRTSGVVQSVSVPPDSPCLHTQFALDGQHVPATGTSDYAWIGMFTGLTEDAERDITSIVVRTERGDQPAYCRPEA